MNHTSLFALRSSFSLGNAFETLSSWYTCYPLTPSSAINRDFCTGHPSFSSRSQLTSITMC
jgi:hypothetical protein